MRKIKKGDIVKVIAGKDKGRTGKVLSVLTKKKKPAQGLFVVVEGINIVKRHTRGNPQMQKPGGIIPKESPIHGSNVMLLDTTTNKESRVGIRTLEDGSKVRYFKSSNEVVDV